MGAEIKGVDGYVAYADSVVFKMNAWILNAANGIENITDFGSDGVERTYTGVVDFTGSVSGQFPLTDTSTGGAVVSQQRVFTELSASGGTLAAATWIFKESAASVWSGSCLISDFSKTNSAEGLQQFTANIVANGRLAHANST